MKGNAVAKIRISGWLLITMAILISVATHYLPYVIAGIILILCSICLFKRVNIVRIIMMVFSLIIVVIFPVVFLSSLAYMFQQKLKDPIDPLPAMVFYDELPFVLFWIFFLYIFLVLRDKQVKSLFIKPKDTSGGAV